jgi:hypothetical protein
MAQCPTLQNLKLEISSDHVTFEFASMTRHQKQHKGEKTLTDQTIADRVEIGRLLMGKEEHIARCTDHLRALFKTKALQKELNAIALFLAVHKGLVEPGRLAKRHLSMLADWFDRRYPQIFACTSIAEICSGIAASTFSERQCAPDGFDADEAFCCQVEEANWDDDEVSFFSE